MDAQKQPDDPYFAAYWDLASRGDARPAVDAARSAFLAGRAAERAQLLAGATADDGEDEFEAFWLAMGGQLRPGTDRDYAAQVFRIAYQLGKQEGFFQGMKASVQAAAEHLADEMRAAANGRRQTQRPTPESKGD